MAYDFKREFRDLYRPGSEPVFVDVPPMTFAAIAGTGDPNEEGGAYARALEVLYGFSYTVKMLKKGAWQPEGYLDFVVAPLEGLWWGGAGTFDGACIVDKSRLSWVSLVRQPDFVTEEVFSRACAKLARKKPALADALESGALRLVRFAEGPCVQVMHIGSYDDEPATVHALGERIASLGVVTDIAQGGESPQGHRATMPFDARAVMDALDAGGTVPALRLHHEIYLSDPRRTAPERLKTVIRHPVREG